jgi:hypothetical protein
MQQSTGQQPVIDNNLLSHIQTLTSQLLNKKPPEPGFNKVYRNNSYNLCSYEQKINQLCSGGNLPDSFKQGINID